MSRDLILGKIVDSHCHLHMLKDPKQAIVNAKSSGVGCLLNVATMWSENKVIAGVVNLCKCIYGSAGMHPCHVDDSITVQEIVDYVLSNDRIIGIGECGFDFHYDDNPEIELQEKVFLNQIYAAQETSVPLIIHTRDADQDTIRVLKKEMLAKKFKFLIHCFSGEEFLAEQSLELGGYISISGVVTFKKSNPTREVIKSIVPLDRLLLETDCPYLTPEPLRGRVEENEPANLVHIVRCLSTNLGIDESEVINNTTLNFLNLFDI